MRTAIREIALVILFSAGVTGGTIAQDSPRPVPAIPGARPGYLPTEFLRRQAERARQRVLGTSREVSLLAWGDAQRNYAMTLLILAEREDAEKNLSAALMHVQNAASVQAHDDDLVRWMKNEWGRGKILAAFAREGRRRERLEAAIESYRNVEREESAYRKLGDIRGQIFGYGQTPPSFSPQNLSTQPPASDTFGWREVYYDLGSALLDLSSLDKSRATLEQALAAFQKSHDAPPPIFDDTNLLQKAEAKASQAKALLNVTK